MVKITVYEPAADGEEMAGLLEHLADLLREGYTSGFHPGWDLAEVEEEVS
jgi:hypothetical protein